MSKQSTRKTFLAKIAAAFAGLGLMGGAARAASNPVASSTPAGAPRAFAIQPEGRAVARSADTTV